MIDATRAQVLLDELKKSYLIELPSKIDDLELLVLKIKEKSDFEEDVSELYRKVHSLKGSSGTHGLHELSAVCHRLEDYLRALNGKQLAVAWDDANRWLGHIDLMRKVFDEGILGEGVSLDVEAELAALANKDFTYNYLGLIVDQSKSNAMLYQSALSALPIKFTLLTDGYTALDLLLNNRFDLLVTSMELKQLNGMALIGAVKLANGVSKNIKTILVTVNPESVKLGQDIRPDKLIAKDLQLANDLLSASKQLFPRC